MTRLKPIHKSELWGRLPEPWDDENLGSQIRKALNSSGRKVVVLDDDPTGTQTVSAIPVLTHWSVDALRQELQNDLPAFYILTNSRSLATEQAVNISSEIGNRLQLAAAATGQRFTIVSRSDSTLRGHFPEEMDALTAALAQEIDGWILCPFFEEGGRYTIDDVHWVQDADRLIPVGHTDFAKDAVFGYRSSDLRDWVVEKSAGKIRPAGICSISITDIRRGGPGRVAAILERMSSGRVCIVNAANYGDLEVFVMGLLAAEAQGKSFLYRTAASFVRVRAGIKPKPLLSASTLKMTDSTGALLVVGSYVPKTTEQLVRLFDAMPGMLPLELDITFLQNEMSWLAAIEVIAERADAGIRKGLAVVIYTSREYVARATTKDRLAAGHKISQGLVAILKQIQTRPRYFLVKGGVTASDVATQALQVRRAVVAGQLLPGVPVWELGPESRFPGCPLIVFPGNVGDSQALLNAVDRLSPSAPFQI